MGSQLNLDDVAVTSDLAMQELLELRAELTAANADVERLKMVLVNLYGELESATLHGAIITPLYSPELLPSVITIFDYIDAAIDPERGKDND